MLVDLVFPTNKQEIIKIAERLDNKVIFIDDKNVTLIRAENEYEFKRKIKSIRTNLIIVEGNQKINRSILENRKVDILLSPEKDSSRDSLDYRSPGLNQVLCKLAAKNNIAIAFSFNEILNAKDAAKIIGIIRQNIKLCRKYKVKMIFASFAEDPFNMRSLKDLLSVAIFLGMTPEEAKKALSLAKEITDKNKEKRSKDWIREGIKLVD